MALKIKQLLAFTASLKHRGILMTTYLAGLRVSETAHLKVCDVDSKRMQLRVDQGKGNKHLGAEIGFLSILHTWGQNLMDHPHLHCLVPGGGLYLNGKRWISSRGGFFIPVKA